MRLSHKFGMLSLLALSVATTSLSATPEPAESKSDTGTYEITLGGGGSSADSGYDVGLDLSVSTNPLEALPSLWFGVVQGVYWEPDLSGSTDINANWSWHLWRDLYANTGWSVGVTYANGEGNGADVDYRTGPELTFQYYVNDGAFVYAGANYDIGMGGAENGFRWGFGIGLVF